MIQRRILQIRQHRSPPRLIIISIAQIAKIPNRREQLQRIRKELVASLCVPTFAICFDVAPRIGVVGFRAREEYREEELFAHD